MNIFLLVLPVIFTACSITKTSTQDVPPCIRDKIESFKKEAKQNPPRSVTEYTYKGKKVYYIPGPCCDQYSELFDSNCNLLGHPDGGFTGKGDGRLTGFSAEATNEKLIWKDDR